MIEAGQVRRNRVLRTTATYRVISVATDLATVEVIAAPGLDAGERFQFTRAQVEAMELVEGPPRLADP